MSAWITDRVPTIKDADRYGGVLITRDGKVLQWDWAEVKTGTPWQPITYPEPYVKPKVWTIEWGTMGVHWVKKNGVRWLCIDDLKPKDDVLLIADALNKLEEGV